MNLVVIEGTRYSFYSLGQHVVSVDSPDMSKEDIEFYRQNLDILVMDVTMAEIAATFDPQQELDF